LTYSSAGGNPLGEIDAEIGVLTELSTLYLHRAGLSSLPFELKNLTKLTILGLWNNRFTEIPRVIFELSNLRTLCLHNSDYSNADNNQITVVPRELVELENLDSLDLRNNPITFPPPEIVDRGVDSIRQFFAEVDRAGEDYLHEAKLLIVGEAGAGKTSFTKKLMDSSYRLTDTEESTEGIAITDWIFDDPRFGNFVVHIWDFGGQEIYHSTHQFFLTKRSLYILIADTRKEDTDFYYWLNAVELLSSSSPVIIVKNEKQDRYREIDEGQLRMRFPNLISVMAVNLATNRGLENVASEVRHHIARLPHVGVPLPRTWVEVRKALEQRPENTIKFGEYLEICGKHGFEALSDKLTLIEYLHDLGVCLNFRQDPLLKKILILKPRWGTDAVYKVLNNKRVIERFGRFDRSDLESMWMEAEYAGMHDELLQLMLNFRICYAMPGSLDSSIAPQRLSESRPIYSWDPRHNLVIRYVYEFMPKGIVTQLIVAMHQWIVDSACVWKSGVVLERDETFSEIIEDYHYGSREIKVRTSGRHKPLNGLSLEPRPGRGGQPEEYENRLIEPQHIFVVQAADLRTHLGLRDGGDLVHHQPAGRKQSIAVIRFDGQAEQRRFRLISGEGTDRDRVRGVETVILDDDDRTGLPGIILAARDSPDVATPHSFSQSDTASMNA
jgi:internalin A